MKKTTKKKSKAFATWREYRDLIRQIAKATDSDSQYAIHFAALLSAMRGPDDANDGLKAITTSVIRNRLGWHCGFMTDRGEDIETVRGYVRKESSTRLLHEYVKVAGRDHFASHINTAIDALKAFGFDEFKGRCKE